ncbi:hypothetical protein [Aeromonas veronii]|uniref:hypothetical protein n=1 Tax=Aeromonas veronii TaxID=654 RepID=UPI00227B55EC
MNINATLLGQFIALLMVIVGLIAWRLARRKSEHPVLSTLIKTLDTHLLGSGYATPCSKRWVSQICGTLATNASNLLRVECPKGAFLMALVIFFQAHS